VSLIKSALSGVVVAGGLTAAILGLGSSVAAAQPLPPDPAVGEEVPAWAPPKPAENWAGEPVVWTSAWGGRWGVWINGGFITLSSNPVTNGG
jgi:hypothetical protein